MSIKKKVIPELFKRKDSNEICLLKKRLLWNFLKLQITTNVFIKKKVILKLFKRKNSNEICLSRKKVIVKFFKRKDSNEISLLKKG